MKYQTTVNEHTYTFDSPELLAYVLNDCSIAGKVNKIYGKTADLLIYYIDDLAAAFSKKRESNPDLDLFINRMYERIEKITDFLFDIGRIDELAKTVNEETLCQAIINYKQIEE